MSGKDRCGGGDDVATLSTGELKVDEGRGEDVGAMISFKYHSSREEEVAAQSHPRAKVIDSSFCGRGETRVRQMRPSSSTRPI